MGVKEGVGVFLCHTWRNKTAEKYHHNFNAAGKQTE
jgi:hypothetical protein